MRRTVTKAPTAMTGPRAKGATAALARAGTEGEAATRDMALSTLRHEAAEHRQAQFRGPHERSVTGRFQRHQPLGPGPAQHLAAHDTAHDRKSLIGWVFLQSWPRQRAAAQPSPRRENRHHRA